MNHSRHAACRAGLRLAFKAYLAPHPPPRASHTTPHPENCPILPCPPPHPRLCSLPHLIPEPQSEKATEERPSAGTEEGATLLPFGRFNIFFQRNYHEPGTLWGSVDKRRNKIKDHSPCPQNSPHSSEGGKWINNYNDVWWCTNRNVSTGTKFKNWTDKEAIRQREEDP